MKRGPKVDADRTLYRRRRGEGARAVECLLVPRAAPVARRSRRRAPAFRAPPPSGCCRRSSSPAFSRKCTAPISSASSVSCSATLSPAASTCARRRIRIWWRCATPRAKPRRLRFSITGRWSISSACCRRCRSASCARAPARSCRRTAPASARRCSRSGPKTEVAAWAATQRFPSLTANTITSAKKLLKDLRDIRERGYGLDDRGARERRLLHRRADPQPHRRRGRGDQRRRPEPAPAEGARRQRGRGGGRGGRQRHFDRPGAR